MYRKKALRNTRAIARLMKAGAVLMALGVLFLHGMMTPGEVAAWTVASVMCHVAASVLGSWCNAAEELLKGNRLKFYF